MIIFNYQKYVETEPSEAFPKGLTQAKALIPVTIIKGKREEAGIDCLVDSGAVYTVFRGEYAEELGINIEDGKKCLVHGLENEGIHIWFHFVILKFGLWKYDAYVGFTKHDMGVDGILGYIGFFDRFKVEFDDKNNIFTVTQNES